MEYKILGVLLISALLTSCSTNTQDQQLPENIQTGQLDSLMTYSHQHGMFNGAIAIVRNDTVLFEKSYGSTSEDPEARIDPETIFYIASISKQFTAMGIMILQESGLLNYDDAVDEYFPELESIPEGVTIRNLLQHTSGISDRAYYQLENPTNQDVLEKLKSADPASFGAPNQRFSYSNTGYVLLAQIIEKVSGKTIGDFLEAEIFDPLSMTRTTTSKEKLSADNNQALGYTILGEKSTYNSAVIGPGGIYATINDLIKWNTGINANKLVTKETLALAFTNGTVEDGAINFNLGEAEYGYGFGWMPFKKDNATFVRHDGSTDGYRALIRKNLSNHTDIMLLTNHGGALAMDEITDGIDQILATQTYTKPNVPLPNSVINTLNAAGIDAVVEMLNATINQDNKPDERVLGRLGYTLQSSGRMQEAIELYKVNLKLYPESINALYILGEAYLSEEKYELAMEIYRQFLAVDPTSKYANEKMELINSQME